MLLIIHLIKKTTHSKNALQKSLWIKCAAPDHRYLIFDIVTNNFTKGHAFWRFSNELPKDLKFVNNNIKRTNIQYSVNITNLQ